MPGSFRDWIVLAFCGALAGCATAPRIEPPAPAPAALPPPARPDLPAAAPVEAGATQDVLDRAADYVSRFEGTFSLVLSDEEYVQQVAYFPAVLHDARQRRREIRSEMLFMHLAAEQRWMAVRSVQQVDGRIIPDSHARLEVLLHDAPDRASRTRALLDEGARFNIGSIVRNITDATSVLRYVDRSMQPRFTFASDGVETVQGVAAWKIRFAEQRRPTIIQHNGEDIPSTGWIFVAQDDGAIVGTVLVLSAKDVHVRITVDYARSEALGLWVPSRMEEEYIDPRSPGEAIHGLATYSNFRQFATTARLLPPGPASATAAPVQAAAATKPDSSAVINAAATVLPAGPEPLDARLAAPLVGALVAAGRMTDATAVSVAEAGSIVEFDARRLRGDPAVLAWSPDGRQLYLQTVQRDVNGRVYSERHYVVDLGTKLLSGLDVEPAWAAAYWKWKSAEASPVASEFRIDVDSRNELVKVMNLNGGAMAAGSPGTNDPGMTASEFANAANASQKVTTSVLSVHGVPIGKWENEVVTPGLTFGWAPSPNALLAFAPKAGGSLTILDNAGRVAKIAVAKSALLPAWSGDATRLAWLERKKHGRYELVIGSVTAR